MENRHKKSKPKQEHIFGDSTWSVMKKYNITGLKLSIFSTIHLQ